METIVVRIKTPSYPEPELVAYEDFRRLWRDLASSEMLDDREAYEEARRQFRDGERIWPAEGTWAEPVPCDYRLAAPSAVADQEGWYFQPMQQVSEVSQDYAWGQVSRFGIYRGDQYLQFDDIPQHVLDELFPSGDGE